VASYHAAALSRTFIAGGAGFIGSHIARELLRRGDREVIVFDNLASGDRAYLGSALDDPHCKLIVGDLKDADRVVDAVRGCDTIFLFAANPDIARAVTEPSVDFWEGTYLTHNVIEAARINGVARVVYSSGSGVYGDRGTDEVDEDFGPLIPVSTYGASKLGCESLLAAYSHMFGIDAVTFRFANVVGDRQTHGVTYDFVRRLLHDPTRLRILGDGTQSKSYIHVEDVVAAMLLLTDQGWSGYDVFNAGTGDYITVTEIADLVVERMGLSGVSYEYTGGRRGWKGDVPVVRFRSGKLENRGWRCQRGSREALIASIDANIVEAARELPA
jgi:UDP-glucose 4-epimerase